MNQLIIEHCLNIILNTCNNKELFLFLRNPERIAYAVVGYLVTIGLLKLLMRFREPFVLFTPIRFYNFGLVLTNTLMTWIILTLTDYGSDFFKCHPSKYNHLPLIARICDIFITTRVVEFLDTIFFALRKKDNQISFLHVFHHAYVPIMGVYMAYDLTSPLIMMPIGINSFIHIIMYSYYTLATYKSLQAYLWWKRHLTKLQLIQFVAMITISAYHLVINNRCNYVPHKVLYFTIVTGSIFMALFVNFYIQSYQMNKTTSKTTKKSK